MKTSGLPTRRKKEGWRSGLGWLWGGGSSDAATAASQAAESASSAGNGIGSAGGGGDFLAAGRAVGLGGADAPASGFFGKAMVGGAGKIAIAGAGVAVLGTLTALILTHHPSRVGAHAGPVSLSAAAGGAWIHAALPSSWGGDESVSVSRVSNARSAPSWDQRGAEPPRPARMAARNGAAGSSLFPAFSKMGGGHAEAAAFDSPGSSGGEDFQAPMGGSGQQLQAFSGDSGNAGLGGNSAASNSSSTAAFSAAAPGSLSGAGSGVGNNGGGGMDAFGALQRAGQADGSLESGGTQESAAQVGVEQFDSGQAAGGAPGNGIAGGAGDGSGIPFLAGGTPASLGGPTAGAGGAPMGAAGSPSQAPPSPPSSSGSGPASSAALKAVQFAMAQLGKPYIWGGTGPQGYDCSGLVQAAYASAGISIPRVTSEQCKSGAPVSQPWGTQNLRPGDLIFLMGSDPVWEGGTELPGHVGMYIGNGTVIQAPYTGTDIQLTPLADFGPIVTVRRVAP